MINDNLEWFKINKFNEYENKINKIKYKKYSQNYEDGIIKYIFNNIGFTNKISCEIGFHYDECNSLLLMENDWNCTFIDSNIINIEKFNKLYNKKYLKSNSFCYEINKDNINEILKKHNIIGEIDFLSIDIDGNDYYIFDNLEICSPRCICIEYNGTFGPNISCTIPYDSKRTDIYTDYWGASYSALIKLAKKKNYELVGVEAGVNLFFIRKDIDLNNLEILNNAWQPPKSSTYINIDGIIPKSSNRLKIQYNKVINKKLNFI